MINLDDLNDSDVNADCIKNQEDLIKIIDTYSELYPDPDNTWSPAHFLKRIDEYRKMKAEQKRKYDEELARKKQSIFGRCAKAPLPKSDYEADEILKNYKGEK